MTMTSAEREALDAAKRIETFLGLRDGSSAHDKDLRLVIDGLRHAAWTEPTEEHYENSHDVSIGGNPVTGEVFIRFVQGEGFDAAVHTLRTTGIVSHELIRSKADGA